MKISQKRLAQEKEERMAKNALPRTPETPPEAFLQINPNLTLCRFFNIGYSIFSIFDLQERSSVPRFSDFIRILKILGTLDRMRGRSWHFFSIGYY